MTRVEIIQALEGILRRTEDMACAEQALSTTFKATFEELSKQRPANPETHLRLLELDPYVNGARRAAELLRDDITVLRETIEVLKNISWAN